MKFLGYVISSNGILVDLDKVESVIGWERLKSVFEIQSFLGLAGHYHRFVEDFSILTALMT